MMNRKQYMKFSSFDYSPAERMKAHRDYYGQLVTEQMIAFVAWYIGRDALMSSTDSFLNDIPLGSWTRLALRSKFDIPFESLGDFYSRAGEICVLKEAARQYIESEKAKEA